MAEGDTGERLSALEVEIGYLRRDVDRLAGSLDRLNEILAQAKGAKWMIGFLLVAGGAASTYLPTLLRVIFARV